MARWKYSNAFEIVTYYKCSACDREVEIWNSEVPEKVYPVCPYCGKEIDGEDDDM